MRVTEYEQISTAYEPSASTAARAQFAFLHDCLNSREHEARASAEAAAFSSAATIGSASSHAAALRVVFGKLVIIVHAYVVCRGLDDWVAVRRIAQSAGTSLHTASASCFLTCKWRHALSCRSSLCRSSSDCVGEPLARSPFHPTQSCVHLTNVGRYCERTERLKQTSRGSTTTFIPLAGRSIVLGLFVHQGLTFTSLPLCRALLDVPGHPHKETTSEWSVG